MLYKFNYYIEEGIIPATEYIPYQSLLVRTKNRASKKVLDYLCETRNCEDYILE